MKGLNSLYNHIPRYQLNTFTIKRAQSDHRCRAAGSRSESSGSATAVSPLSGMVPAENEALGAIAGIIPRLAGHSNWCPQTQLSSKGQGEEHIAIFPLVVNKQAPLFSLALQSVTNEDEQHAYVSNPSELHVV